MQITIPVSGKQLALVDHVASEHGQSREELLAELLAAYLDTHVQESDWLAPDEESRLYAVLERSPQDARPEGMTEEEWVRHFCAQGMEDVRAGRIMPHEEAMRRVFTRLESSSRR
jgi:predicted transcriptional regulator